ncbi:MAG: hypothetical protein AAF970_17640 [Bacteroidota bacterium]
MRPLLASIALALLIFGCDSSATPDIEEQEPAFRATLTGEVATTVTGEATFFVNEDNDEDGNLFLAVELDGTGGPDTFSFDLAYLDDELPDPGAYVIGGFFAPGSEYDGQFLGTLERRTADEVILYQAAFVDAGQHDIEQRNADTMQGRFELDFSTRIVYPRAAFEAFEAARETDPTAEAPEGVQSTRTRSLSMRGTYDAIRITR